MSSPVAANSSVSVVILAAGLGTRMRSNTAKVLHRAGGLALVEHVVRLALTKADAENVVVVVGHQADRVKETLAPYAVKAALQAEQKGTGHALQCAQSQAPTSGYLVVLYGDAPFLSQETLTSLIAQQQASKAAATVLTADVDDPTGYGRIVRSTDGTVAAIVEHKAASEEQRKIREINSGIYCFRTELVWQHIDKITTNNPAGEYYLTDIVELLRQSGYSVDAMKLRDPNELLGINTRVELAEMDRLFRDRKTRELMLAGVTIEKPETVTVDVDVTVGQDSLIEAHARLTGTCTIGENVRIGTGSVLHNMQVADGASIDAYCVLEASSVGEAAKVGPFARLRMNSIVSAHAHVGNFVELKNTTLGEGAKANHLAYLGDASIGAKSNIGAGAITCNYDGANKHKTEIGADVFVGSNSTLVAPLQVEANSYVAAGSVITDKVTSGSLALGRARQTNKEGWVAKKKPKKA